jgi:hypothetical protein
MFPEIQMYCNQMAEVRQRISLIQSVLAKAISTGTEAFDIELIFIQFRKTLELIAFSSLCANKTAYSAAHAKFDTHWRAKAMLDELEKVNPDFYPVPLDPPQEISPGQKHFPRPAEGFMTKDEFASLYNSCGDVLHTRNPFTTKDPVINIGYSVQEWVARIQRLLGWHAMFLLDGGKWVIHIPPEGNVQAWPASPLN